MCIYIYIHIVCVCVSISIYIYIYTDIFNLYYILYITIYYINTIDLALISGAWN